MDDLQIEELKRACVVIGEAIDRAVEMIRVSIDGMVEAAARVYEANKQEEDISDLLENLQRAFDEFEATELLSQIAIEPVDIPPPKKIPRPPKRLCPVNKVNYAANRPPRRARSNCRSIKH